MRLFIFSVFSLLLLSCSEQKTPNGPIIIKSDSQSVTAFLYCVKFDDGYAVTTENNELFFLNQSFEIDSIQTQQIQPKITAQSYYQYKGLLLMYHDNEAVDRPYVFSKHKEWVVATDAYFSDVVYEDESYVISTTCHGEFGGTVFFKHKKTNKIYSCIATCLTSVTKLNNNYYITSALGHLGDSSRILEIKDPTTLVEMKKEVPLLNNWWIKEEFTREDLLKGTEKIIDTFGIFVYDAFSIKNKLYYLNKTGISNSSYGISMGNILLSTIKDQQLVTVDTIYAGSTGFGTHQKTNKTSFFLFNDLDKKVFITRNKDTINIQTLHIKKEL